MSSGEATTELAPILSNCAPTSESIFIPQQNYKYRHHILPTHPHPNPHHLLCYDRLSVSQALNISLSVRKDIPTLHPHRLYVSPPKYPKGRHNPRMGVRIILKAPLPFPSWEGRGRRSVGVRHNSPTPTSEPPKPLRRSPDTLPPLQASPTFPTQTDPPPPHPIPASSSKALPAASKESAGACIPL